jgi:hypothetical protein
MNVHVIDGHCAISDQNHIPTRTWHELEHECKCSNTELRLMRMVAPLAYSHLFGNLVLTFWRSIRLMRLQQKTGFVMKSERLKVPGLIAFYKVSATSVQTVARPV